MELGKSRLDSIYLYQSRLTGCTKCWVNRKTQDALNFIYSFEKPRSTFWIHCASSTQFDEDCWKLSKLVRIPEFDESDPNQDVKAMVQSWFEADASGDWILVLDNADNMLDFFPDFKGGPGTGLARYKRDHRDYHERFRSCSPTGRSKRRVGQELNRSKRCGNSVQARVSKRRSIQRIRLQSTAKRITVFASCSYSGYRLFRDEPKYDNSCTVSRKV